ncbi:MAG: hypothetical protein R3E31_19275 [Chloroflexota bacterium]
MLAEDAKQLKKQRYTAHTIFELMLAEGYKGSESNLRRYVGQQRQKLINDQPSSSRSNLHRAKLDKSISEALVVMNGEETKVQLFVMRLC